MCAVVFTCVPCSDIIPWKPEEGVRPSENGITGSCKLPVGAENEPRFSVNSVSTPNYQAISLAPHLFYFIMRRCKCVSLRVCLGT